jgi:hypothetical protein
VSEKKEGFRDLRVVLYEVAIIACKTKEFADFCDVSRGKPFPYFLDFDVVHVYRTFAYSYS